MIRILPDLLSSEDLADIRTALASVQFVDGRVTNPQALSKQNLQAPQEDPANARIALIAREAALRSGELRRLAMPRSMARTTVVRYEPGMNYGWHVDEALFASTPPIRSDLSCTIFLTDPADYDGGELTMQLGAQELAYKLPAGHALLYPSTTIHQVAPVTRGVRIAAITWLQSWIADAQRRELLIQLDEARGLAGTGDPRLAVLLGSLNSNLFRMWADT